MRSHDPYVRLILDRILAGHGEVLQEFPLRPRSTRRVDALFVPGPPRDDAIPLGEMARITARPAALNPVQFENCSFLNETRARQGRATTMG